MARTKKSVKIQSSRDNFDAYAKRSGGFGFHKFEDISVNLKDGIGGIGCCVSLDKNLHCFIMSTDSDSLEATLKELGVKKSERSAADVSLVAVYPAVIMDEDYERLEEAKRNEKVVFWVVHRSKTYAEMLYGMSLIGRSDLILLGEAERCTKLECKLLLRGLKWNREDIDAVKIDDEHPDNKIPF